jgi:hypothetical protein
LLQQAIDQRGLAMVDVGDNGDVAKFHSSSSESGNGWSTISPENRDPLFRITLKTWNSKRAHGAQKGSPAKRTGQTLLVAMQYSQKSPKNNEKPHLIAQNSWAFPELQAARTRFRQEGLTLRCADRRADHHDPAQSHQEASRINGVNRYRSVRRRASPRRAPRNRPIGANRCTTRQDQSLSDG